MSDFNAHGDPGADPADEWDRAARPVHTHGPEDGPGLACPERTVGGRRTGACVTTAGPSRAREELFRHILGRTADHSTDAILADFPRLAALLGYVEADGEEWGVLRPGVTVFTGHGDCDEARRDLTRPDERIVRRLVGPWEAVEGDA